jgi:hypothetical protein
LIPAIPFVFFYSSVLSLACPSFARGEAVQADHDKLAESDNEAAGLRAELAGLQDS